MAGKNFFSLDLAADTATDAYTVTATNDDSFAVNFCNRTNNTVQVYLWISATGTPTDAEAILYGQIIYPLGSFERTGLIAQAGKHIVVKASAAGVSANGYGYEE